MSHKVLPDALFSNLFFTASKSFEKGRSQEEVDTVIQWLTGYSQDQIHAMLNTYRL